LTAKKIKGNISPKSRNYKIHRNNIDLYTETSIVPVPTNFAFILISTNSLYLSIAGDHLKGRRKRQPQPQLKLSIVPVPTRMVFPDLPPGTTTTSEASAGNKRKITAAGSKKSKSSSSTSAASVR
jgi:hypothetical protein